MVVPVLKKRTPGAQAVDRALFLLITIAEARQPMHAIDLAAQADLHPSTVNRLLKSLVASQLVAQQANSLYCLGPKFLHLANRLVHELSLGEVARPFLQALADKTGESIGLIEREGWQTVVMERIHSQHPLHVNTPIGGRGPLHATAVGKVLLAHMDEAEREEFLGQPLAAFTEHTITDPGQLREEIASVRRQGYAIAVEDYLEGITTVAAPIVGPSNTTIAAISISEPSIRTEPDRLRHFCSLVVQAAQELSSVLGAPS